MRSTFRRKARLVGLITAFWLVVAGFSWLNDVLLVLSVPELELPPRGLQDTLWTSMLGALLGGLLGGAGIVFVLTGWRRAKPWSGWTRPCPPGPWARSSCGARPLPLDLFHVAGLPGPVAARPGV